MKVSAIRKAMIAAYSNGGKLAGKARSLYTLREIERFCTLIGSKHIYEYTTVSKEVADILIHYGVTIKEKGIGYQVVKAEKASAATPA